jgi:hypothetical protein
MTFWESKSCGFIRIFTRRFNFFELFMYFKKIILGKLSSLTPLAEEFERALLRLEASLNQMLDGFLARCVGFAAHDAALVEHKILPLKTTARVLSRTIPDTPAAADSHHATHLGKRSDVILTRRVVRRFDVLRVVLHRILGILGILGIHHAKKVHVLPLTKQKIFF